MKNIALSAVAAAMLLTVSKTTAADVPSASFGQIPAIEKPALSPDGRYVAAVLNTGEFPAVAVAEFGGIELTTILRLDHPNDRIGAIQWANDDRLIVTVNYTDYYQGNRFQRHKMHAVNRDGTKPTNLIWGVTTPGDPHERGYGTYPVEHGRILSLLPAESDRILIELFESRTRSRYVYKLNIYSNRYEKQLLGLKEAQRWVLDTNGDPTLSIRSEYGRKSLVHEYRDFASQKWIEYKAQPFDARELFLPLLVSAGRALVWSDRESGFESLWDYDFETDTFGPRIFAADPYDLWDVIWDYEHQHIIGASFYADKFEQVFFDAKYAALQQTAKAMLPDFDVSIASMSRDASRIMLRASRSDSPPKYLWVDFEKQAAGAWFSEYPQLESVTLSKTEAISYVATDGTPLSGYLTSPASPSEAPPPLVVYAHDGPRHRFANEFDPLVQLLASRGFAVLQVNHRGSAGFGLRFREAGDRQWGGTMQQDIYDGIDWQIGQKTVSGNKICVLGAGYGGYVALTAAHQAADRLLCAISLNGITDLRKHLLGTALYGYAWTRNLQQIGDPEDRDDRARLDALSPISNIDRIAVPTLLIHGEFNPHVALDQFTDFRFKAGWSRLGSKNRKKHFDFVELENGTHAIDSNENRQRAFEAVDRFLKKYLR